MLKSSGLISGILAGNPGMAALQQEGQATAKVMQTGKMLAHGAKGAVKAPFKAAGAIAKTPENIMKLHNTVSDLIHGAGDQKRAFAQKRINRMNAKKDYKNRDVAMAEAKNAYDDAKKDRNDRKNDHYGGINYTQTGEGNDPGGQP